MSALALTQLDKDRLPRHIAIIMDGNGRWAKDKGEDRLFGHYHGVESVRDIVEGAAELGIEYLTLYAFSTENWDRSKEEVGYLMNLFTKMIDEYLKVALEKKIRIIHLGRKDRINTTLKNKIIKAEELTNKFNKNYLCVALDYGGRDEIIRAIKKISSSKFQVSNLIINNFNNFLDSKDLPNPDPDLIIRTSGEMRISGFLIWQAAYAEYIFFKKYLPDFTDLDLVKCLKEYSKRQRRFGK